MIKWRRMRREGQVGRMGGNRNTYRLLVEKPEGKRPLRITRHTSANNIKMNLGEIGCGGVDRIVLHQDRDKLTALVNAVMNLRVPQHSSKI
jgi:hypothetical protein